MGGEVGVGVSGGGTVGTARVTVGRGGMVAKEIASVGSCVGATVGVLALITWPQAESNVTSRTGQVAETALDNRCDARTKKRRLGRGVSEEPARL